MDSALEVVSVPAIVGIVYLALFVYKQVATAEMVNSEKWIRIIPLLAAVLGVILGVIAYFCIPEIMPADNVFMAILIGGASGLTATGINQIYKQLSSKDEKDESGDGSDDTNNKKEV